jgi:hypothetical protein
VLDHRPRRIERIVWEELADVAHRAHLEREAELVVRRSGHLVDLDRVPQLQE